MAAYKQTSVFNSSTAPNWTAEPFQVPQTGYRPEVIANIVFYLVIAFATTANNVLVICAFHSNPRLLRPAYVFILSLAAADLMVGVIVLPLRVVEVMAFQWTCNLIWCQMSLCLTLFSLSASILNLLSVTCDRFIAISYPLKYYLIVTNKRVGITVATIWVASGFLSFCPFAGIGRIERTVRKIPVCRFADTMQVEYMITYFALICAVPTVVISVCYLRIYYLARRQERQIAELTTNVRTQPEQGSSGPRRQISFHRESKAAKTVGIVVGVFYLCWVPFIVGVLLTIFNSAVITHIFIVIAGSCTYSNSALNPIIYGCLNQEFRNAYRKLVCSIFWKQGRRAKRNSPGSARASPNILDGFIPKKINDCSHNANQQQISNLPSLRV